MQRESSGVEGSGLRCAVAFDATALKVRCLYSQAPVLTNDAQSPHDLVLVKYRAVYPRAHICVAIPLLCRDCDHPAPQVAQDLSFSAIEDMAGHEAAAAATRIDRMASKIPNLVERVTTLFDGLVTRRGHSTTTSVAKNQMIASLHNCIRSLRATRTLIKLSKLIPSLDVDLPVPPTSDSTLTGPGALSASTVEVDSLQFMANSYCSAMMYVCISPF